VLAAKTPEVACRPLTTPLEVLRIRFFFSFIRAQQSSQFFPQHIGDRTTHASITTPSKIATIVSDADVSWIAAGAEVVDVGVGWHKLKATKIAAACILHTRTKACLYATASDRNAGPVS
jgi:uncharacterized membrane protein